MTHQKMGTAPDEQRDYNGTGIIRQYIKKASAIRKTRQFAWIPVAVTV
ncbi:MAG: hypothetical protein ACLR17_03140 [Enterobacteriaceae bacterium]